MTHWPLHIGCRLVYTTRKVRREFQISRRHRLLTQPYTVKTLCEKKIAIPAEFSFKTPSNASLTVLDPEISLSEYSRNCHTCPSNPSHISDLTVAYFIPNLITQTATDGWCITISINLNMFGDARNASKILPERESG